MGGGVHSEKAAWRSRRSISVSSSSSSVSFLWAFRTEKKHPFELTHSLTLEKTWRAIVIVFVWFLFFSFSICTGQIWRSDAELLGAVWRPRWLRGCRHGFTPLASSHRAAPSGGDGDPLHSQPAGSHVPGRGAHQSSPHPDVSACTHQGSIAAGCGGGTLLTWKPTHALLYREEDFTGEPGGRSDWECFQRHGKRRSQANKPEIWNRTKPYYERNSLYWSQNLLNFLDTTMILKTAPMSDTVHKSSLFCTI